MNRKKLTATVISLFLIGVLVSATSAATVSETKTKNLPIAGPVLATTSFLADVNPGTVDTVCITIWPSDPSITISRVEHRKTTPRGTATLSNERGAGTTTLCVDVLATGTKVKTVHLKAIVSTEEGIGVNLHF